MLLFPSPACVPPPPPVAVIVEPEYVRVVDVPAFAAVITALPLPPEPTVSVKLLLPITEYEVVTTTTPPAPPPPPPKFVAPPELPPPEPPPPPPTKIKSKDETPLGINQVQPEAEVIFT
jgi:hypothetical protein